MFLDGRYLSAEDADFVQFVTADIAHFLKTDDANRYRVHFVLSICPQESSSGLGSWEVNIAIVDDFSFLSQGSGLSSSEQLPPVANSQDS